MHEFLNAAAGEGLVLGGVDAADLYVALFPERYAKTVASLDGGSGAEPASAPSDPSPALQESTAVTDADLSKAAREGFDSYWHEYCEGVEEAAWLASAKAVLALAGGKRGGE